MTPEHKASNKNSENQFVWNTCLILLTVQFESSFDFPLFDSLKEFLCGTKFSRDDEVRTSWSHGEKLSPKIFMLKEYKSFFLMRKICYKEWRQKLKNKAKIFSWMKCELFYSKIYLFYWMTLKNQSNRFSFEYVALKTTNNVLFNNFY